MDENDEFFDTDGYPTDYGLELIKKWDTSNKQKRIELINFCMEVWKYEEYVSEKNGEYFFSTGGWSGNESIIYAMESNRMFWMSVWYSTRRGGHFEFRVS